MRAICDNGHHYIVDNKDNLFYAAEVHTAEERASYNWGVCNSYAAGEHSRGGQDNHQHRATIANFHPVAYHPIAIAVSARLRQPPIMTTAHNPSKVAGIIPPACRRRIFSGGNPLPASRQKLQSPILIPNKALVESEVYSVSLRPEKTVNVKWLHNITNLIVDAPNNINTLACLYASPWRHMGSCSRADALLGRCRVSNQVQQVSSQVPQEAAVYHWTRRRE